MALVLVVDDSQYARRVHARILEAAGHEVVEAASGAAAIEAFALRAPDVVILDLTMEDIGGVEVLGKLRELNPAARVVVVSADVQRTTAENVRDAGAHAFVGKPVDGDALVVAVKEALASQ